MSLHSLGLLVVAALPATAFATVYSGPGVRSGVDDASAIAGTADRPIREVILDILKTAISFMGLAAVVVIVIGGIMLVVGMGNDETKEKVKKIILFTIIGLIVILLARAIVEFIANISTNSL